MKINETLSLQDCLYLLNAMLLDLEDYDYDSESIIYVAVNHKNCSSIIRRILASEDDYNLYIKTYKDDETIDITGLWCEVCCKFNVDIWIDLKKKRFYVCKWYHRVDKKLSDLKRKLKREFKLFINKYNTRYKIIKKTVQFYYFIKFHLYNKMDAYRLQRFYTGGYITEKQYKSLYKWFKL